MSSRNSTLQLLFFTIDILLTLVMLNVAKLLREQLPLGIILTDPLKFSPWLFLIVPIIWGVVFTALGVYTTTPTLKWRGNLSLVWTAIIGAALIFAGVAYLLFRELSRFLFFYFLILDLVALSGWRLVLPKLPGISSRLHRFNRRRVLIVGTGVLGQTLAEAMTKSPQTQLVPVGFADDIHHNDELETNLPILGTLDQVPELTETYEIDEVIFTLSPEEQIQLRPLIMSLYKLPVNLRLVPDIFDLVVAQATIEDFAGVPLVGLREPAIQGVPRLIKRVFDIVVSLILLILLLPITLLIGLFIKLGSPGPIFFQQERVAEGGRLFKMYKFRSMVQDAHLAQTELVDISNDGLPRFMKKPDDPRITDIGAILRRTSLDELPQLFNVLKGDMSLVGPRPELPGVVDRYEWWQRKRFAVPQGMTGWWQVNGRMDRADPLLRNEDDLFYIKNYSLWLDLRILWKTVLAVIRGEGAY